MSVPTGVLLNKCYGGFSLSAEAVKRCREISGDPNWGGWTIIGDVFVCEKTGRETICERNYGHVDGIERNDPVMIQAFHELGSKRFSGDCAAVAFHQLDPGDLYSIEEYDGQEWIETPGGKTWSRM